MRGQCYDCGEVLERCEDCGEVLCFSCEGAEHELAHRNHERERLARLADIDAEYGYGGYDDHRGW